MSEDERLFTDDEYDQIKELSGYGLTQDQIASVVGGFSGRTFRRRMKKDDKARTAYDAGRALAIAQVAGKVFQLAVKGVTPYPMFFLKCQANWKETGVIEHRSDEGGLQITVTQKRKEENGPQTSESDSE